MTRSSSIGIALAFMLAASGAMAAPQGKDKPSVVKPVHHVMPATKDVKAQPQVREDSTEREIWRHHGMS